MSIYACLYKRYIYENMNIYVYRYMYSYREIMLFMGKPIERSVMISSDTYIFMSMYNHFSTCSCMLCM